MIHESQSYQHSSTKFHMIKERFPLLAMKSSSLKLYMFKAFCFSNIDTIRYLDHFLQWKNCFIISLFANTISENYYRWFRFCTVAVQHDGIAFFLKRFHKIIHRRFFKSKRFTNFCMMIASIYFFVWHSIIIILDDRTFVKYFEGHLEIF